MKLVNILCLLNMTHIKCRNGVYIFSNIARLTVPDELVSWDREWLDYNPPNYTSKGVFNKPWADPDLTDLDFKPKWNEQDGPVNRVSYTSCYKIENGYPLNPIGRTGLRGRGLLGKWGPNHAADPIVTRWRRDFKNNIEIDSNTSK